MLDDPAQYICQATFPKFVLRTEGEMRMEATRPHDVLRLLVPPMLPARVASSQKQQRLKGFNRRKP